MPENVIKEARFRALVDELLEDHREEFTEWIDSCAVIRLESDERGLGEPRVVRLDPTAWRWRKR